MSKEKKKGTEETVEKETVDTAEPAVEEAPDPREEKIKALEAELAESREKYLRMLAEYDNYRKRTQKEREGAFGEGLAFAVAEILPVLDNLERASAQTGNADKIAEGLALTRKQAEGLLTKLTVEETAKVGDTFDPNLHEAVMHIEDDEHGEGEIVEVFQRGYKRGERVIRFAMVKVAN